MALPPTTDMNVRNYIVLILFTIATATSSGQDGLRFSGQVSSWMNINSETTLPLWGGARYIPQINFQEGISQTQNFDMELSANLFGSAGLRPFDSLSASGNLKPYRLWARYSTEQFELRLGLQKLNFGSATMLRPLMWFDQLDPRDPLQLTDGVWGILARYHFLNNANIWLWGLYGNNSPRGWDIFPTTVKTPEFGGRFQLPIPKGEAAISYHHRSADSRGFGGTVPDIRVIPENRIGFDAKVDIVAGLWIEGSYTKKEADLGLLTNQLVLNMGVDYTFGIGNGLYIAYEQLLSAFSAEPFTSTSNTHFSALTATMPVSIFDQLSTILYYDWRAGNIYSFINWKRQFDKTMLYLMAFWNPDKMALPTQSAGQNIFAGRGIQIMFVYNH